MPFSFGAVSKLPVFIRLFIPLAAGIIAGWYVQLQSSIAITAAVISFIVFLLFFGKRFSTNYTLRWLPGLAICIMMLSLGILITWQQDIRNRKDFFKQGNVDAILVTLQEPLLKKTSTYKATAKVDYIKDGEHWRKATGNIFVYFFPGEKIQQLGYGSQLFIKTKLVPVKGSGNPGAFNYKRFSLFQQNVTHQVFIHDNDYAVTSINGGNKFTSFIFSARDFVLHVLQQNITDKKTQAVAEALLIGYRNDLDKELLQAYSNSGVVHIIAISGLHIGFIYLLLLRFFSLFPNKRITRTIRFIVVLSVLWIFTLMAGRGPSIMRAAIMYSFILIGETMERKSNIINSLGASAFLILLINPFNLWDVGFQLSYIAVLSIVLFYDYICKAVYVKNKSLKKVWQLTSVTLAAQILTLPIVIFHFHQLPSLFLVTNLLAVPLSTLILCLELLLICFSWFTWLAKIIGIVTSGCIWFMNGFIEYINKIPFSVWNGIKADVLTVICLYACIVFIVLWIRNKSFYALLATLVSFVIILADRTFDIYQLHHQRKLIVYNISRNLGIDFIDGNHYSFTGNNDVLTDHSLYNFNIKPCHQYYRITDNESYMLPDITNKIVRYNNKNILIIDKAVSNISALPMTVDYLIISGNPSINMNDIHQAIHCREIIAASNNAAYKIEQWKKDCEQLHLRFHAVAQKGAFVVDF